MVDFVLRKHARISISISRTIFLTCFVVAKLRLTVILPTNCKNQFLWETNYFCRFFHPAAKTCRPCIRLWSAEASDDLKSTDPPIVIFEKTKSQKSATACTMLWSLVCGCTLCQLKMQNGWSNPR